MTQIFLRLWVIELFFVINLLLLLLLLLLSAEEHFPIFYGCIFLQLARQNKCLFCCCCCCGISMRRLKNGFIVQNNCSVYLFRCYCFGASIKHRFAYFHVSSTTKLLFWMVWDRKRGLGSFRNESWESNLLTLMLQCIRSCGIILFLSISVLNRTLILWLKKNYWGNKLEFKLAWNTKINKNVCKKLIARALNTSQSGIPIESIVLHLVTQKLEHFSFYCSA